MMLNPVVQDAQRGQHVIFHEGCVKYKGKNILKRAENEKKQERFTPPSLIPQYIVCQSVRDSVRRNGPVLALSTYSRVLAS